MDSRPLLFAVVLVGTLIGVDAARRHRAPTVPSPVPVEAVPKAPAPVAATRGQPLRPAPGINQVTAGTPTLDLMARLAVRRRIEREGSRVYFDSLLAKTDSMLVRWVDREAAPLTIAFEPDTTMPGWSNAFLDDIRSAIQVWGGNSAGLRFREATGSDSADIKVRWVQVLGGAGQLGVTNLNWNQDGEVSGAEITLAVHDSTGRTILPVSVRRRVAAHEFGHALGLPHSAERDDLMFPSVPVLVPSRRDQATLQLLYALPPGSLRGSD